MALQRLRNFLFAALLLAVPFAEWKNFNLPLHGKALSWEPTGFGSISIFFDPIYFALLAICVVLFFKSQGRWLERLKSEALLIAPLGLLLMVMPIFNPISFPWLSDINPKIIGFRSVLMHALVLWVGYQCAVALPAAQIAQRVRRYHLYGVLILFVLSLITFSGYPWLESHYPFQPRFTLSFPFWNQNLMAPFVAMIVLGVLGMLLTERSRLKTILLTGALGITVLAAGLTGSRSSMVLLTLVSGWVMLSACVTTQDVRKTILRYALAGSVGVVLLCLGLNWEPIARSVSLFSLILQDPMVLIRGDKNGARGKIWANSTSSIAAQANAKATAAASSDLGVDARVSLVAINEGCLSSSKSIQGLKAGQKYRIRMFVPAGANAPATLDVFQKQGQTLNSLGHVDLAAPRVLGSDLLLAGMSTELSRRQRFKFSFSSFQFPTEQSAPITNLISVPGFDWSDQRFRKVDPIQTPHLEVTGGGISMSIVDSTAKTEVSLKNALGNEFSTRARPLTLEYDFSPEEMTVAFDEMEPFVATGVYETFSSKDWSQVRNGLFIRQALTFAQAPNRTLKGMKVRDLANILNIGNFNAPSDEEAHAQLLRHFQCTPNSPFDVLNLEDQDTPANFWLNPEQKVPSIWKYHWGLRNQRYWVWFFDPLAGDVSNELEQDWSVSEYLAGGSSTLSVYKDWWVFVGVIPFLLFLGFIVLMNTQNLSRLWMGRAHPEAVTGIVLVAQVLFLSAYLYPQPFLFIKFYWLTWGIAAGFMRRLRQETLLS